VAEASTDLTARKAPVLFGWAEQGRAAALLRPDGDPTQGAGTVKSGGTRAPAWEEPDFSEEAGAARDTRAPVRGADRMAGGFWMGNLPAGLERSGDTADRWHKRSRFRPRSHLRHARRIATEWRRRYQAAPGAAKSLISAGALMCQTN